MIRGESKGDESKQPPGYSAENRLTIAAPGAIRRMHTQDEVRHRWAADNQDLRNRPANSQGTPTREFMKEKT